MKLNHSIRSLALVALLGVAAACDMDLTNVNENPNNPEIVPPEAVLSSGIWDMVSNTAGRGIFGDWTLLYHTGLWAQHVAQSAYFNEDRYTPREGMNQNIWEEMYAGALTDLKDAQKLGEAMGDDNLVAVSDILMVYGFLFLTDLFGDVPYFEALDLENHPTPAFTPQEQIYPDLLQRLEVAAGMLDTDASPSWASGDLIYNGNLEQWQEFANSLRLRIAMRTSNTPYAATAAQEFAAAWNANKFDSNADNADLGWTGTLPSQNAIYENLVLEGRDGDFRMSHSMIDALQSRNDPRLSIYAKPALSDGQYRGLPNGADPQTLGKTVNDYSTLGARIIAPDFPSTLMSYSEMLFLGAEAAQRGWIAADPAALYRQGIQASMLENGVAQSAIDTYLAQPSVAYAGLQSILLQKWIATFLAGGEAFAELRRTGLPNLPLSANAVIDRLPARMPYPPNEALYNSDNFAPYENVEIIDPLWWMD